MIHKVNIVDTTLRDIYIISQFVDETSHSTGYLWALLIQSARRAGYQVYTITPPVGFPMWMPKLIVKFFTTLMLLILCLWRLPRHSTVLCATNPAFLPLALGFVQVLKRIRLFVLVHDLFPQNTISAGWIVADSRSYRLLNGLFRASYRRCAGLIVIGRDMRQVITAMLGPEIAVLYVPNWVQTHEFVSTENCKMLPTDICRFQYFGNLGTLQGLDDILTGIAKSKAANARFEFIGSGAARAAIATHPILSQDTRIVLRAAVDFIDRSSVLGQCDISLVTLRPQMYGLAVPSKAYFSVAHGIPFLYMGDENSELHLTLQDYPALGWFVPAGKSQALADQIDLICTLAPNPDMRVQAHALLETIQPDLAWRKIVDFLGV